MRTIGATIGLAVAWAQPGLAKTALKQYRPAPERAASQGGTHINEETCGDPYWDCQSVQIQLHRISPEREPSRFRPVMRWIVHTRLTQFVGLLAA